MKAIIRYNIKFLVFVFIFLVFTHTAFSDGTQVTVNADGMAAIIEGNTGLARDQAIKDALRKAVEQTVGTMITSETLIENYEILSDRIYSKSQGYVRNYQIVSEQSSGELYEVTVQATVATGTLQNDLAGLGLLMTQKNMPRVIIMVAEQNVGQEFFNFWWGFNSTQADLTITENTLMEKLIEKGFNVIDHSVAQKNAQMSQAYKVENLSTDKIIKIGDLYGAEIVIYGKALAKPGGSVSGSAIQSSHANITLRVVNTDTGRVIASASNDAAGVHINEINAGTESLKRATEGITDKLIAQIINRWSKDIGSGAMLQVIVSEVFSYETLVKFKDILQTRVRGVNSIYQRSFAAQTATLDVDTTGSAQDLADQLSLIKPGDFYIEIVEISQNIVKVRLR